MADYMDNNMLKSMLGDPPLHRSKHKRKEKYKSRSRSRSHRKKKHHKKKHKKRHQRTKSPSLKFSDEGKSDQELKKNRITNQDDLFRLICNEEIKPQRVIRQDVFQAQSPIIQRRRPDIRPHFEPVKLAPAKEPPKIPPKQQPPQLNPLDALVMQKKGFLLREPDILGQEKLLEELLNKNQVETEIPKTKRVYQVLEQVIPAFPTNVPDSKRDAQQAEWWSTISNQFFPEKGKFDTDALKRSFFEEPEKWYDKERNEYYFSISQQSDCYEPLVLTHFATRGSINVIYKTLQQNQLVCYKYEQKPDRRYDKQIKIGIPHLRMFQNKGLKKDSTSLISDTKWAKFKDHYGQELRCVESFALTSEEVRECMNLHAEIHEARSIIQKLSLDDEFQYNQENEIDISYHVLKQQLKSIIAQNNSMKDDLERQISIMPNNMADKIQEQHHLMDRLKWLQIISFFKKGYSDKTKEVLNCYFRIPQTSQSDKNTKQKGLNNMQRILSKSNSKPLDTDCKICFNNETSDINPVIYCDGCKNSFHRLCYGIQDMMLEQQEFLCEACRQTQRLNKFQNDSKKRQLKCAICSKVGLPIIPINNQTYHVACLVFTNSIVIRDGKFLLRPGVTKDSINTLISDVQAQLTQCAVCGNPKGFKLKCQMKIAGIDCRHAFHPICAYLNGLKMEVVSQQEEPFPQVAVQVTCALHMEEDFNNQIYQVYYRRYGVNFNDTAKLGGFENFREIYSRKETGYQYLQTKQPIHRAQKFTGSSIYEFDNSTQRDQTSNEGAL